MTETLETIRCRACRGAALEPILDLGETPVADLLLDEDQLASPEPTFSLVVGFCPACLVVQIMNLLPQDAMYTDDYPYYTSAVPGLVEHFSGMADSVLASRPLGPDSLVIEAASNDGYLLRLFAERGIPVLGIDPASGPARAAEEAGVPTIVDFFGTPVARTLSAEGRRADVVLGNNVLNLVPFPDDFAEAVDLLLADDGVVVLEVPYLLDTVDDGAYDNFFHQNSSYFSLTALDRLFRRYGIGVTDVEKVATFGGSLRVTLERDGEPGPAAVEMLQHEESRGVLDGSILRDFAARCLASREALIDVLQGLRAQGQRVIAYGAAGGMATTLLAYAGIDSTVLDYAVDANPHKHGRYTPGSHLLIRSPEVLVEDQPDVVLLLAWNYADAVLEAQHEYRAAGGRFLVPIPLPHFV